MQVILIWWNYSMLKTTLKMHPLERQIENVRHTIFPEGINRFLPFGDNNCTQSQLKHLQKCFKPITVDYLSEQTKDRSSPSTMKGYTSGLKWFLQSNGYMVLIYWMRRTGILENLMMGCGSRLKIYFGSFMWKESSKSAQLAISNRGLFILHLSSTVELQDDSHVG